MRILFAEDDKTLSRGVTALLEHDGYLVDAVENGSDAMHYAQREHYDCIILDVMMPGMDGLSVVGSCGRHKTIRRCCSSLQRGCSRTGWPGWMPVQMIICPSPLPEVSFGRECGHCFGEGRTMSLTGCPLPTWSWMPEVAN